MAELVDALVSGTSARKGVEVQVLFRAPRDEPVYKAGLFICNFGSVDHPILDVREAVCARVYSMVI